MNVMYYNCIMQILVDAYDIGEDATRVNPPDAAVVDAVLSASRSLMAVATRSPGAAAEETTIAQYRARADRRAVPEALRAFSDAAGEVPDSRWPPPGPAEEGLAAHCCSFRSAGEKARP